MEKDIQHLIFNTINVLRMYFRITMINMKQTTCNIKINNKVNWQILHIKYFGQGLGLNTLL